MFSENIKIVIFFLFQCVGKLLTRSALKNRIKTYLCQTLFLLYIFFTLPVKVELLLEGLQGAEMCDTYRFHVERGYGTQYFTQVFICIYLFN